MTILAIAGAIAALRSTRIARDTEFDRGSVELRR
jgi:hypothetical protein